MKNALIAFCIVLALLAGFFLGDYSHRNDHPAVIEEKVDTLYVRDTITLSKPVFVEKRVIEQVKIPVTDTLRQTDTLFVYLDREQVVWQDSLSCVYASGILPRVDSVKHFVCDKIVTIEKVVAKPVKSRWGLGVQAGYGAGKDGLSPYVGVGISYNLLSW